MASRRALTLARHLTTVPSIPDGLRVSFHRPLSTAVKITTSNLHRGFVVVIFPEVRRPAHDERGILPAPSNRPSIKSPGLMGAPDNWGYLYAPHGRRGNSTLVVSVDHTVSSLNAAHRSQKSSFGLTADKIVGYKGNPSILRHRAWGNEGLDNPEVPYAVDECTRGHESNPLGPHAAQSTANQTFRRLPGGARPGRAF